jgi:hypothetical protein
MKSHSKTNIVRRSIALPIELVEEIRSVAPKELGGNFNRLVITALKDFSARRKKSSFEEAINQMGSDPEVLTECRTVSRKFHKTEKDGLPVDN